MVVACGGHATSGTSRERAGQKSLTGSLLRSEASEAGSVELESQLIVLVLVMLLVVACVWVLLLVQRQRYYRQRHRPEAEPLGPAVLVRAPQLPIQRGPRGQDQ